MDQMVYCTDCRRIFKTACECTYCKSANVQELAWKAPVNVIGTKLKGRVLKTQGSMVQVYFAEDGAGRTVRLYEADELKKIL